MQYPKDTLEITYSTSCLDALPSSWNENGLDHLIVL